MPDFPNGNAVLKVDVPSDHYPPIARMHLLIPLNGMGFFGWEEDMLGS